MAAANLVPGPHLPPAPEQVIMLAVTLDKTHFAGGDTATVPAHHMVFAVSEPPVATGRDFLTVVVDMAQRANLVGLRLVGVTLEAHVLHKAQPEFTVAVSGAVTLVADCGDTLQCALPGHTLYWQTEISDVGFTCAPAAYRTAKTVTREINVPVVPSDRLRKLDPVFAHAYDNGVWADITNITITYADPAASVPVVVTLAQLKANPLWHLATGDLAGRVGMLLACGNPSQNECRVLLNL